MNFYLIYLHKLLMKEQVNWLVSGANNHIINNISNRYTKHFKSLASEDYNVEESYN